MILIASGAYVLSEFQVELGQIPPCLLPIGNRKLIEFQVEALKKSFPQERIYVTLPDDYVLSSSEKKIFERLKVNIVIVPTQFNLCESLLYAINTREDVKRDEKLYLMHGDTYFSAFDKLKKADLIALTLTQENYNWHIVKQHQESSLIWCGFFSFSAINYLLKSLTLYRDNFVKAVQYYSQKHELKEVITEQWFDFGHVNTYFHSRANITTQRAFNTLNIKNGVVVKKGNPQQKILAEANWYVKIPSQLREYIPVLIDHGLDETEKTFYCLEYLPCMPLNELYVHGRNLEFEWIKIFKYLCEYMQKATEIPVDHQYINNITEDTQKLYVEKSHSRFSKYLQQIGKSHTDRLVYNHELLPSLGDILEDCINKTIKLKVFPGVLHGDLCFSNILFDSRAARIKVIDPRGMNFDGEFSIYGDIKYDLAKLTHSVIGLYDFIISGYYRIEEQSNHSIEIVFDIDERITNIQEYFLENFEIKGLTVKQIMPLVVLLFMSMLPLHDDRPDRQKAMFYNALRLYSSYVK